jgi:hypothetical protein
MTTRLFVLLARKAPVGVIFRRGPSKQVLLVRWDLTNDTFEPGQWFKGRIYEHRCDLSPRGERLVYFAASWRRPYQSWTAVSRPPYLTALALWPKGDAWGGGGLFEGENELLLNHGDHQRALAEGFRVPARFKVGRPPHAGRGEDEPIFSRRMERDGWTRVQQPRSFQRNASARIEYQFTQPEIWQKVSPDARRRRHLRLYTDGILERDGAWYIRRAELAAGRDQPRADLGRVDWIDWSPAGNLLLARAGKIHRVPRASLDAPDLWAVAHELVDLSSLVFEPRAAPAEARRWTGP